MKNLILTSALCSALATTYLLGNNPLQEFSIEQIQQLNINQENTLKFEVDYAGKTFISKSDLALLENNEILQIDLVYTKFKRSKEFDQTSLNQKRIKEFKEELPFLKSKNIKWNLVEQTGAKAYDEAKNYFHRFVFHFGKSLNYNQLSSSFSEIQKTFTSYSMDGSGGEIQYSSGTKITIPENAVTYLDGTPVEGDYEIKYREFRNPADIAFSGIPILM